MPGKWYVESASQRVPGLTRPKFPYPCIGQFRFLSLGIANSPHYDEVLQRLRGGEKLLDVGCCFGQEIRKLVCSITARELP